jgi:hypothetical protein
MRHRIIAAIVLLALVAGPAAVRAQEEPSPDAMGALERSLLEQLCSVDVAADADLTACLLTVAAALSGGTILPALEATPSAQPQDLLAQARQAVDEALASAQQSVQQLDLQAAVDEALASARDVDLRAALDEVIAEAGAGAAAGAADLQARIDEALAAASDVDVEAALAEVVAAAQAIDLQTALDEALASLGEAVPATGELDVEAFLAGGVQTTREVIAMAQTWAKDNADAICAGSGLSVGVAAAGVVAYLTGSPGLAITAFEKTERLGSDVCSEVAQ